jgi:hypothetical protein
MKNVTGKVLVPFTYKGEDYKEGDEITISALHAGRYEKLGYIKLTREAEKKVNEVITKEKNNNAGPGAPPRTK